MLLKTSDLVTLKFVTSFREYHWLLFRWCTCPPLWFMNRFVESMWGTWWSILMVSLKQTNIWCISFLCNI